MSKASQRGARCCFWPLRRLSADLNRNGDVWFNEDGDLVIEYWQRFVGSQGIITMPRRDARLMAKRINQALDYRAGKDKT